MKKIVRLTESDLARIVKRVIRENNNQTVTVTPKIPSNLGFNMQEGPVGEVVDWKTGQPDMNNPIARTNIIIKPGAKITRVKKGVAQIEGLLYFRKEGGKAGDVSQKGTGIESSKVKLGTSIPKTIWYDCPTSNFYLYYDGNKVIYGSSQFGKFTKFDETEEYIAKAVCGMANQADLQAAFRK